MIEDTRSFNSLNADILAKLFVEFAKNNINIEKADSPVIHGYVNYTERKDLITLTMDSRIVGDIIIKELSVKNIIEKFDKILEFLNSFEYRKTYIYVINVSRRADYFDYLLIMRFAGIK
jgi:hypothetical protein